MTIEERIEKVIEVGEKASELPWWFDGQEIVCSESGKFYGDGPIVAEPQGENFWNDGCWIEYAASNCLLFAEKLNKVVGFLQDLRELGEEEVDKTSASFYIRELYYLINDE